MKNYILSKILLHLEFFPGLPKNGTELLPIIEKPKTTVGETAKVLCYDPGLTANFLKLANSAFLGIPSKINSVKQAIVLLGVNQLKQIVLATCTSSVRDRQCLLMVWNLEILGGIL